MTLWAAVLERIQSPQMRTKLIKHLVSVLWPILTGLFRLCHLFIYFSHEQRTTEQSGTVCSLQIQADVGPVSDV